MVYKPGFLPRFLEVLNRSGTWEEHPPFGAAFVKIVKG